MQFFIAESFTAALARLSTPEQKAVKTTVFDLQIDPTGKGLSMHRIEQSKDGNFWSARVSGDIRLIVHKTESSTAIVYVDHHDKAYAWAERRRIEKHPRTGAIQIVEIRERVEEIPMPLSAPSLPQFGERLPFSALSDDELLSIGVPTDWVADIRAATEDRFFQLVDHLPGETSEALLEYAATGLFQLPVFKAGIHIRARTFDHTAPQIDPYLHPDTGRRLRLIETSEELEQALDYPWERWGVFLHPSQRTIVERDFAGPSRVAGSAGTGKTVVALHRAVRLARLDARKKILLATFSEPLALALKGKLKVLAPDTGGIVPRITFASFTGIGNELFQLVHGKRPRIPSETVLKQMIEAAVRAEGINDFSNRFLLSEWSNVVDAWGIKNLDEYVVAPRHGRKSRLGPKQRERLWPVFAQVRADLKVGHYLTWNDVFSELAAHYSAVTQKPFDHVVIDEAQDLGPTELRFFAAVSPRENGLFLAGDLGQRIFQHPFSWKRIGIDIQGRSAILKICYRTSQQIRKAADGLLPAAMRDVDGNEEERKGTISVFSGPPPAIVIANDEAEESRVAAEFIRTAIADGIEPKEIGIFVRTQSLVDLGRAVLKGIEGANAATVSPMHLAKGLEFRCVVVMACNEGILPLDERVTDAADEAELDDIYETERQLFYVACTRARDRLLITGIKPGSEFLADIKSNI